MMHNDSNSYKIRKRYDRNAFLYDVMEAPLERFRFAAWRRRLHDRINGRDVLEVGVGSGKNLPFYSKDLSITAIDFSPRMLARAKKKAVRLQIKVDLIEMDVQHLQFPDNFFDTIFATFVFCSVSDPVIGLKELHRVCKPEGSLLLLEHMRPENRFLGYVFDTINPMVVRMMGANINRKTIDHIHAAGWVIQAEKKLSSDIVRLVEAVPGIDQKG